MNQADLLVDEGYDLQDVESKGAISATNAPKSNIKMTKVGQPCRKCQTPIEKRTTKKKKQKSGQTYYFEWYLFCPGCKSMYMVEEAKRLISDQSPSLFDE